MNNQNAHAALFNSARFKEATKYCRGYLGHLGFSKQEVDEIASDAMFKILTKIDKYDPERSLKNWMTQVYVNTARDFARSSQRNPTCSYDNVPVSDVAGAGDHQTAFDPISTEASPYELMEEKASQETIRRIVTAVASRQADVFLAHVVDDLSRNELATKFGYSNPRVSTSLATAVRKLQAQFSTPAALRTALRGAY